MRNAGIQAAYTQAFKGGMAARTFEGRFKADLRRSRHPGRTAPHDSLADV